MKITWRQLVEFQSFARGYLDKVIPCANPKCDARIQNNFKHCPECGTKQDSKKVPGRTKLRYALDRILTQLKNKNVEFREKQEDIENEHYNVNDEGVLTTDAQNNFQIKKVGEFSLKARTLAFRKLQGEGTEIEPFISSIVPNNLTDLELEVFGGIVISPEDVRRIRETREKEGEEPLVEFLAPETSSNPEE